MASAYEAICVDIPFDTCFIFFTLLFTAPLGSCPGGELAPSRREMAEARRITGRDDGAKMR
jgi:hypothetical protein